MKTPRILYFVNGMVPNAEALEKIKEFGSNTGFRNNKLIDTRQPAESCDGVAGDVPSNYKHLPNAEKVMAEFNKSNSAKRKKLNEIKSKQKVEKKEFTEKQIMLAIRELTPEQYTEGGLPEVSELEDVLGGDITAAQRDKAYDAYQQMKAAEPPVEGASKAKKIWGSKE